MCDMLGLKHSPQFCFHESHSREEKTEPTILKVVAIQDGQCLLKWKLGCYFRGWYWDQASKKTKRHTCACGKTLDLAHFQECLHHRSAKLDLEYRLGSTLETLLTKVRTVDLKDKWNKKLAAQAEQAKELLKLLLLPVP